MQPRADDVDIFVLQETVVDLQCGGRYLDVIPAELKHIIVVILHLREVKNPLVEAPQQLHKRPVRRWVAVPSG